MNFILESFHIGKKIHSTLMHVNHNKISLLFKEISFFIIYHNILLFRMSFERSEDNQVTRNSEQHTKSEGQMPSLEKRVEQICKKSHILPDPKYLCCLRRVYKGRLNLSNLEHSYILLFFDSKRNQKEKSQSLNRPALNYRKDVVILIGANNELQTLGIPESVQQFQQSLQNAIKFISPFPQDKLKVKKVPIIFKESSVQTGRYLITIKTMNKNKKLHYFMRPRYYPTYCYIYFGKKQMKCNESSKQKYHNASLQISEAQGEELYKILQSRSLNKHNLNHQRHYHQCFQANQSISVKQQIYYLQQFQKIKTYIQKYQSFYNFAIVKFESQNEIFQHSNVINDIEMSLSSSRKNFIIMRIKQNYECELDEQNKVIFFFIFMHDYPCQHVKNVIKRESSKVQFEYYEGSQAFKLRKFKISEYLNFFKEKDRLFISLFSSALPLELVDRYAKKIKENQEQLIVVYYQIKWKKSHDPLIGSILAFLINLKLGFSPQFINQKTISNPKYECPFKKQLIIAFFMPIQNMRLLLS